jgi:hypothetical protein
VEVRSGITTADTLITGGASSLRDNDTLVVAGQGGQGGRRGPGAPGAAPKTPETGAAGQDRGRAASDGAVPKRPATRPGQ